MKKKIFKLIILLVFVAITMNYNLFGQSLIVNGDFAAGINTNWEHRTGEVGNNFSEQNGGLKAEITKAPSNWWKIGIINFKKDNTITKDQIVMVSFKAETTEKNAKLKLVMYSPEIDANNIAVSFSVDLTLEAGSKVYKIDIPNTQVTRSNWEFNLFFLNIGTFLVDDIEVIKKGDNLARSATASATASAGVKSPDKAVDGIRDAWSGWEASSENPESPVPQSLDLSWNTAQSLNNVVLYTINNESYALRGYTIQYWDGTTFQDLAIVSGNTSPYISTYFNTVTTTKIRVRCTNPDIGSAHYRIDEIEVYYNLTTGVNDMITRNKKNSIIVYTTSNETVVEANENIHQLQVYSMSGTLVFSTSKPIGTSSFRLPPSIVRSGLYVVVVNGVYSQKFIVR